MSLSTDDGRSVELHPDDAEVSVESSNGASRMVLPPIAVGSESFSDSFDSITGRRASRRLSRPVSIASRRMSYMTELRSKRDRSDTASLMTVDEITAEVESRRASKTVENDSDTDEWTKVESEDDFEDDTLQDAPSDAGKSDSEDDETSLDDDDASARGGK